MCWWFGLQLVPWRGEDTQSDALSEGRVLLEEEVTENMSLKCVSCLGPFALFAPLLPGCQQADLSQHALLCAVSAVSQA